MIQVLNVSVLGNLAIVWCVGIGFALSCAWLNSGWVSLIVIQWLCYQMTHHAGIGVTTMQWALPHWQWRGFNAGFAIGRSGPDVMGWVSMKVLWSFKVATYLGHVALTLLPSPLNTDRLDHMLANLQPSEGDSLLSRHEYGFQCWNNVLALG